MQVLRIILCLGLVLCAPVPSFAAHREKKAAVHRKVSTKKKIKKKKIVAPRPAPKPPAEKKESPKFERKLEDTRWMDPVLLRDTLFLSAEKRILEIKRRGS